MARIHGRSGSFTVGAVLVSGVSSFSYDETTDSVDATAMGDASKQYLGGLRDGSGTIEARLVTGDFTSGGTGQGDLLVALAAGTEVSVALDIGSPLPADGEVTGYTGSVIVNSFAHSQSFDDVINITFGFQGTLDPSYSGA